MAKVTGTPGGMRGGARALLEGRGRVLVGLAGVGVLLVLVSGLFGTTATPPRTPARSAKSTDGRGAVAASSRPATTAAAALPSDPVLAYEAVLDRSVAAVLDQVRGAGAVAVAISVSRSPSRLLVRNLSTRRESQGAMVSSSLDEALAFGRGQVPVSTGEDAAPLVGALVVAPGATDPMVRAELTQAVETLLGLAANQVIVLPGRRGGA